MDPNSAALVREGDIIAGKYRIERVLGQGAMGMVTAAMHVDLHERRAIKFMLPSCLGDAEFVERFMREARACARLKSRHVATVYDVGRLDNGAPYIVMEYLEGVDLKTLMRERKLLPIHEAVDYMLQACEAIGEAHQLGVIHRDIKPANMFLASGVGGAPCVKVLDFGIAKLVSSPGTGPEHHDMTTTDVVMGSPLYMSPEQMRSSRYVDARADIWSLGVVLYVMVTGVLPFQAGTTIELCAMILSGSPPRPSDINRKISPELDSIIMRCLEKDPANRWTQIADLANALRPYTVPQAEPARTGHETEGPTHVQRATMPSIPLIPGVFPFNSPPSSSSSPPSSMIPPRTAGGSSPSPLVPSSGPMPASTSGIHGQSAAYSVGNTSPGADLSPQHAGESTAGQTGGTWAKANGTARPPPRISQVIAFGAAVGGTVLFAGLTMFLLFRGTGSASAPGADSHVVNQEGNAVITTQSLSQKPAQAPEVIPAPTQSAAPSVSSVPSASPPKEPSAAQAPSASPPKEPSVAQAPSVTTRKVSAPAVQPKKSNPSDSENPFGRTRR